MQLFSYNPHPFLFIDFSSFSLFNNMLYCFSQHVLTSQHVFMVFLACFLTFAMIYHFDVVGLAFLGQDMSKFNVCAQIHMLLGSLPCFCLDLHAYVFFAMFMLRSMFLWAMCYAYAQILAFLCSMPCLCDQIYMLVAMPCASIALLSLDISLSFVLALIGRVQIQIPWSRPTSTHLTLYQRVWIISLYAYVCLLYVYVCLSRSRPCHALCPPWVCSCVVKSIPPRGLLGCDHL